MKLLVVGLGSMGKRRIRLLKQFFPSHEIAGVDLNAERRDGAKQLFSVECFDTIEQAVETFSPNAALVCTAPLSHGEIIKTLLSFELDIFTEINLVSDLYSENIKTAKQKKKLLFLSSTQMYRKEIEYLTSAIKNTKDKKSYRYHVGQYLPDWHPWESYKDFFVGNKRTNGCREIFGIELPWLTDAFGEVVWADTSFSRLTKLEIDYPDYYAVTLEHADGTIGQLTVDIVSRKATREFVVISENLYLTWSGTPSSLMNYDTEQKQLINISCYDDIMQDERYSDNIVENAYVDELAEFFDALEKKAVPRHSFEKDLKLLYLIDKIEGISF